jgi:DNA (cytosine-5)-methyltransferase 1
MIRVGTDCSGIEGPIQALLQLKIPFEHKFCSDIDKYCIESIKANYNPEIIFGDKNGPFPNGDITKRNIKDVPDIDLYVCGFPCQPFSQAGKREGFKDKRGNVFFSCLEVIKKKKPKYFILENVKGLITHNKGNTWEKILKYLQQLKKYSIFWKILNTRDYGIPQNRERVYIIGIDKKYDKFIFPDHIKMDNITNYIDNKDTSNRKIAECIIKSGMLQKIPKKSVFVDLCFQKHTYPNSDKYSPCVTANSRLWCIPMSRYANVNEYLKLQGFSNDFKQVISKTQMKKQIGNAMSINVIKSIIKSSLITHKFPYDLYRSQIPYDLYRS